MNQEPTRNGINALAKWIRPIPFINFGEYLHVYDSPPESSLTDWMTVSMFLLEIPNWMDGICETLSMAARVDGRLMVMIFKR